jgi:hypothetical protein
MRGSKSQNFDEITKIECWREYEPVLSLVPFFNDNIFEFERLEWTADPTKYKIKEKTQYGIFQITSPGINNDHVESQNQFDWVSWFFSSLFEKIADISWSFYWYWSLHAPAIFEHIWVLQKQMQRQNGWVWVRLWEELSKAIDGKGAH